MHYLSTKEYAATVVDEANLTEVLGWGLTDSPTGSLNGKIVVRETTMSQQVVAVLDAATFSTQFRPMPEQETPADPEPAA